MTYPAEPWHLEGQMHVSLWLAPRAAIPQDLPPGTRPVTIAGRCPVGTAVVLYEADSVLRYTELLCAVLVRRRARVMPWITEIWVDSPPSRDGGRALWGIPKELASFGVSREMGLRATASDERGCWRRRRSVPRCGCRAAGRCPTGSPRPWPGRSRPRRYGAVRGWAWPGRAGGYPRTARSAGSPGAVPC